MDLKVSKWVSTGKFKHQDIIDDFTLMVASETAHETAESTRASNETTRTSSEATRVANESNRVSAESSRTTAEKARASAETTRQNNETTRINAENIRNTYIPYNDTQVFVPGNKTTFLGSTYVNIVGCVGVPPTDRADNANWVVIAMRGDQGASGEGTGDMLSSVYDTDSDGKVDAAETADVAITAGSASTAGTADKLATARNINGVSFDGTADITVEDSTKEPVISSKNTAFNQNFETNTANIKMNSAVSVGASNNVARADHVHPVDTSREAAIGTKNTAFNQNFETTATNIKMNGTQSVGTSSNIARADHVHPVDTSRAASSHNHAASSITTGTLGGQVNANATAEATVTTAQVRDISAGTSDLTAGVSALTTGTIYLYYV
jgi:hypothetical protein